MTSRRRWLDIACPQCGAAPGARCCEHRWSRRDGSHRAVGLPRLHVARGWCERPCPTCKAPAGEPCRTPGGRPASSIHTARLRPGRHELLARSDIWDELARREAHVVVVPFWGRAGRGGETGRIRLSRLVDDALVDVEPWTGRDEVCHALEAPVWERFGLFAGQPLIRGEVIWTLSDHVVVITGTRGVVPFEERAR